MEVSESSATDAAFFVFLCCLSKQMQSTFPVSEKGKFYLVFVILLSYCYREIHTLYAMFDKPVCHRHGSGWTPIGLSHAILHCKPDILCIIPGRAVRVNVNIRLPTGVYPASPYYKVCRAGEFPTRQWTCPCRFYHEYSVVVSYFSLLAGILRSNVFLLSTLLLILHIDITAKKVIST